MSDPYPDHKINRKKIENLERLKRRKEAKISKNKLKKLAQIAERKRVKHSRESLFDKLQMHQISEDCMKQLISAKNCGGHKRELGIQLDANTPLPKKLRCVSGKQLTEIAERKQKYHIETDSSDAEEIIEEEVQSAEPAYPLLDREPICQEENDQEKDEIFTTVEKNQQHQQKTCTNSKELSDGMIVDNAKKLQEQQKNFYEMLSRIKGQHIFVQRKEEMEVQRRKLPINAEEQPIVEAINENSVVILCGETGSGKTTQVPQFLYEAGYTSNGHLIGVTEPRRIAAISMAARVGEELAEPKLVSYQIRYEGNRTDQTKILFMTDGVLLKELQADFTLSRYSAIVIDEAHERSIYSDVLIGLLSRICIARLKRQYPLKLIIMSATLRLEDFLHDRLFPKVNPVIMKVDSRQFSVSMHFERRTPENYLEAAFKKVRKIHEEYPAGGILVFLSGQQEVEYLARLLEQKYPTSSSIKKKRKRQLLKGKRVKKRAKEADCAEDLVPDYDEFGAFDMDDSGPNAANQLLQQQQHFEMDDEEGERNTEQFPPLHCLPLYSLLPTHLQKRVFDTPPDGARLCVLATNVAETSLTIPNIRYVVDSGKEKRREYDPVTGVSRFVVSWCSQASADQRSGRAGRVQSGYTFRLYSSAVYEDMQKYLSPEILNKPMEQLVLLLKSMNFAKIANFPFPTPPTSDQITSAETKLLRLGALESINSEEKNSITRITKLGRTLVQIPLSPGFAKMLTCSLNDGLLPYAITLVSALSVREPLIPIISVKEGNNNDEETKKRITELMKQRRIWCALGEARHFGDLTILLNIIGAADYEDKRDHRTLCSLGLRPKALAEINKLRAQLVKLINTSDSLQEKIDGEFRMEPPSQRQLKELRRIVVSCFPDKIAKKVDQSEAPKGAYRTQLLDDFVYIDPTSMLFKDQPDFVLYQEIVQMNQKKSLQTLVAVEPEWIPDYISFNDFK